MAVNVTDTLAGPFYPNGITTEFPFDFKAATVDELVVSRVLLGVTLVVDPDDYSVTLAEDGEGGTVVFASAPVALDGALFIEGEPDFTQEVTFSNSGFLPAALNSLFDRAALRDLKLRRDTDRAVKWPIGTVAPPMIGLVGQGQALALVGEQLVGVDSVDGDTALSSANAAAALADRLLAQAAVASVQTLRDESEGFRDEAEVFRDEARVAAARNAFPEYSNIKWPGESTDGEGLALLFGDATWHPSLGQLGVDFGNTTPEGSLAAGSTHPQWSGGGNVIAISQFNTAGDVLISGYDVDGSIDFGVMDAIGTVRNCVVRGVGGSLPFRNIMQNATTFPIYVEDCQLIGSAAQNIILGKGHLKRSRLIECNAGGHIVVTGPGPVQVEGNLVRKSPSTLGAHSECMYIQAIANLDVVGNTFYLPDGSLPFGEGATGADTGITAAIFLNPYTAATVAEKIVIAGNILAGGAYALYLAAHATSTIRNVAIINNVIVKDPAYTLYGAVFMGPLTGAVGYTRKNILFFGNVDETGAPSKQGSTELDGIWNFDKSLVDTAFRELGQRCGYLDWNGDCLPEWNRSA